MKKYVITFCFFVFFTGFIRAQLPGLMVRPAGSAGPAVLDTNINGFTSRLTSGFAGNDFTNSELSYKTVAPVIAEPTGDLLRGPSGSFSDIVKTFDGSGFYLFSDGANLLCRLRIGGIVSGSKGYSILLDTDQKFGPSGPNADPNFQAATNGNNGNPGFEYEVVFETNFRIAVYNVDGTSTPVFVTSYTLATNSQVSVAATTDGGNPDYFYDFYVPFAAIGLNSASVIRATATTVMSPGPAIGGPKSDIYGLAGNNYMEDWNSIINAQPSFAISRIANAGSGISAPCTAAPVVNGSLTSSSVQITGTWTNSTFSANTKATIRIYNGAVLIGTVDSVSAGASWQIPVVSLADGSLITATAHSANESLCLSSNEVRVKNCNASTHTASPGITCADTRGFEGTRVSGASVKLYKLTSAGYVLLGDDATTTYRITYPTLTTWFYDDVNDQSVGSACSGGAADIDAGAYMVTATLSPNCASIPTTVCIGGAAATAAPIVTSLLIDGLTEIKGTAPANAGVFLFIDDFFVQSVVASATGAFTFTLSEKLSLGQVVKVKAVTTGLCESAAFTGTVSCYVAAPVITANTSGRVTIGAQLRGTSSAAPGSTISVYNASTLALINTTTVQANGTWTLSTPVIAAGTTYNARVTGHACGSSAYSNSATAVTGTSSARCGSITTPADETVTSVSGSLGSFVAGTIVNLYVDGDSIGTVTTLTDTNPDWTIPVNTTVYNKIYSGAVLTITVAEGTSTAVTCTATSTVPCVTPAAPSISPAVTTITAGQSVTYTISGSQSGILYSIRDNADANNVGGSTFGNGAAITATSDVFSTPGIYTLKIKATSLSGSGCASSTSSATVTVVGALPISLTTFKGMYEYGIVKLNWETVFEQDIEKFEIERSSNSTDFKKIGEVTAVGNSSLRNNYFFNDADWKSDILYYRLRIIDRSSSVNKYSKVVVIRTDKGIVINQVAPNPFSDVINLSFNASGKMPLVISLKDMMGRTLKVVNYITKKGLNNIPVNGLQRFSAGTYVLEVVAESDRIHRELLIKR